MNRDHTNGSVTDNRAAKLHDVAQFHGRIPVTRRDYVDRHPKWTLPGAEAVASVVCDTCHHPCCYGHMRWRFSRGCQRKFVHKCYLPTYCINCGCEFFPPYVRFKYCSARCRRLYWWLPKPSKSCDRCGSTFTPPRSDARYCSGSCRQAEYRARKAVATP